MLTLPALMAALFFSFFAPTSIVAQKDKKRPEPTVLGKAFEMPDYDKPTESKEVMDKQLAINLEKVESPSMAKKMPSGRTRGETVTGNCGSQSYRGRCNIYQFVNQDFATTKNSCGQAAISTAMWTVGLESVFGATNQAGLATSVYAYAPPKIIIGGMIPYAGSLGSDWRQLSYGMDGYKNQGIKYSWLKGEAELKRFLDMKWPAVIMLDTGTLAQYGYGWYTGHWVTAYGYDASGVYVTNFPGNKMTWAELRKAWGGVWNEGQLAKVHGTAEMFAVVWK